MNSNNQKTNLLGTHPTSTLSKYKRIHEIVIASLYDTFDKIELCNVFNSKYEDKIDFSNMSKWLSKLWKEGKVLRTETQTETGYIYSLKNQGKLNELYNKYLLPYEFENKKELIKLMLNNSFETLKTDQELKFNNIQDLDFFNKYGKKYFNKKSTKLFLAELVAFVIGDGNISEDRKRTKFFFKEEFDAYLFKKHFNSIFPNENIKVSKMQYCYACRINNKSFGILLEILGAPTGNKVMQPFLIPEWIYHGSDAIKLAFLSVIYGNEGSKPQDNKWRIQFVISKNKENLENLLIFLNQIRSMLNYFEISTSFIQIRKQKGRNFCGRFYIKGKENLHKFYKLLEFSYASEKQKVLKELIENSL